MPKVYRHAVLHYLIRDVVSNETITDCVRTYPFCNYNALSKVVLAQCRSSKIDPMYCSTENWKTLTQWEALGYRYPYGDLPTYGLIYGFTSSACKERCIRIHRSLVRKK